MDKGKIGQFIAICRKDKKLTQEQLAEKLNISKNAVSKWERGICLMDMSFLKPLSEILEVSVNDILSGEKIPDEELSKRLLVHEYGHTIQSLIFGPLYLIVMGIPSTLWGFLPYFQNKRNNGVSYFSFFTEKLANYLGEKVTKEKSMENAII